jgi:hypothetical protein
MKKSILVISSIIAAVLVHAQSANFQWAKSMGGTSEETGCSIALDASGNVYTTGYFSGTADFDPGIGIYNLVSAGSTDIYISKLDASGNFVWAKAIGSTGDDVGRSLCIDASGNVYTTGYFSATADFNPGIGTSNLTSAGQQDVFIIKLDASGNFVWAKMIGGTNDDRGYGIALDASGNILTAGSFYSTADFDPGTGVLNLVSAGQSDIFVLKLNSSGNFMWAKVMGGADTEGASSIAVDAAENVYTTGSFQGGTAADFDPGAGVFNLTSSLSGVFISKLDASGNFVWATAMAEAGGVGTSIFIDVYSNVFTTGYFSATTDFAPGPSVVNLTPTGFYDVFVSKLSSSGYYIWAKNMGGNGADFGHAVTADAFGNVYTTGDFQGGTNADFDPGTGVFNFTSAGGGEIFISKLDPSGNFVWAKAMSGSNYEDGRGIVIDGSTNVYITGRYAQTVDFNPGTAVSNLTSAGVNDAFVHKMSQNSPGSPVASFTTSSTTTCVGNPSLFLSGSTGNPTSWTWDFGDGTSSAQEITAHVFTSGGTYTVILTATNSFGSDTASAVIYVNQVDVTVSSIDSTITASNSNGTYQWIDCDNGNAWIANETGQSYTASDSGTYAVIITENGCVDTSVCTIIILNQACEPNQPGLISGNTSVTAGTSETYSIAPVAGATSYSWTLPLGWTGSSTSNSITVVTGTSGGVITVSALNLCGISSPRTLVVNMSTSGTNNQDWVWAKSTGAEYNGRAMDIATDALGNAYITGTFGSSTITFGSITLNRVSTGSGNDVFIAKYDANGNALWAKNASILTYVPGSSIAIATDANNNVFISGAFDAPAANFSGTPLTHSGSSNSESVFIVKYDSEGNLVWAKDFDYTGTLWMYDLATDSQGNSLITGSFGSSYPLTIGSTTLTPHSNTNPFVAKFDSSGNPLWAKGGESATNFGNWSYGVATDANDNVFITGEYVSNASNPLRFGTHTLPETNSSGRSMYIVKFDSSGDALWVKASTSPSSSWSYAAVGFHVTTDASGNAIVAGSFKSSTVNFGSTVLTNSNTTNNVADMFIAKYDSSGNELWAKKAGGTGDDEGHKISSDAYGNTYVSGYFESVSASFGSLTITKEDSYSSFFFVVKYDDLGNEVWVKHVENTNAFGGGLMPNGVSADDFGNVYVTGDAYDSDQYDTAVFGNTILIDGGVFIAKLGETLIGIEDVNNSQESMTIFPNPGSGAFHLKKPLPKESEIKVYNLHGQIVFESSQFISEIDLSNKPKGIYFIQIQSEDNVFNKKLIIQ